MSTEKVGRLAFVDHGRVIFMNADGTGRRDAQLPMVPNWSRDGRRTAYTNRNEDTLYFGDREGRHRRQVTRSGLCFFGDWSPSGRKYAYQADCDWDFSSIWVVNADGSRRKRLRRSWSAGPEWSPDGRRILFIANPGHDRWSLFTIDPAGKHFARLRTRSLNNVKQYAWSPDGKTVFLHEGERLFAIALGSGRMQPLSGSLKIGRFDVSPDGRTLALQAAIGNRNWHIWVEKADGHGLRQLTSARGFSDRGPTWSPGGTRIAYGRTRGETSAIHVISADGTRDTNVGRGGDDGTGAVWIPGDP